MSANSVKATVNKIFADAGQAPVVNWAWEFADATKMLAFFNILFNETVEADIEQTTNFDQRINNWNTLNKEIFVDELARRVYLDDDSVKILAKGQSDEMIVKLLAVLIGFQEGTAEAYATEGEIIELGDIDEEILQHQEVKWNIVEVYATASDTSDEERKTGFSREKIIQAPAKRTVVETRHVEQDALIEEYTSEELVEEVRKKSRPASRASRASRVVVREETESEEEVVEVRRRPRRVSAKRSVVRTVRKPSKTRKVEYVEETASESEEEVVQVKRAIMKQRVVAQEPKQQMVIVEEPQVKVTKSAKETIKVPVQRTKTEYVMETVNIETQDLIDKKASLANLQVEKEHAVKMKVHQIELTMAEVQRAREHALKLEQEYETLLQEHEQYQLELDDVTKEYTEVCQMPISEQVERAIMKNYTEYVEKKVRRKTTETPVAKPHWEEQIMAKLSQDQPASRSPSRQSLKKRVPEVSPVRSVQRVMSENVSVDTTKKVKAQQVKSQPVNKKK